MRVKTCEFCDRKRIYHDEGPAGDYRCGAPSAAQGVDRVCREFGGPDEEGPRDNLDALTVTRLRTMAADAGIEGRSSMRKDELIEALRGASAPREAGDGGEAREADDEDEGA